MSIDVYSWTIHPVLHFLQELKSQLGPGKSLHIGCENGLFPDPYQVPSPVSQSGGGVVHIRRSCLVKRFTAEVLGTTFSMPCSQIGVGLSSLQHLCCCCLRLDTSTVLP